MTEREIDLHCTFEKLGVLTMVAIRRPNGRWSVQLQTIRARGLVVVEADSLTLTGALGQAVEKLAAGDA